MHGGKDEESSAKGRKKKPGVGTDVLGFRHGYDISPSPAASSGVGFKIPISSGGSKPQEPIPP